MDEIQEECLETYVLHGSPLEKSHSGSCTQVDSSGKSVPTDGLTVSLGECKELLTDFRAICQIITNFFFNSCLWNMFKLEKPICPPTPDPTSFLGDSPEAWGKEERKHAPTLFIL
jgi:hypothetical protein